MKMLWCSREDKQNGTEVPATHPDTDGQAILSKGAETLQWQSDSLQQMVLGKLELHM